MWARPAVIKAEGVADPIQRRVRPNGTVNQTIRKPTGLRSTFRHASLAAMYRQPRRLHPLGRGQDRRVFAHGMDVQVLVWWLPIPHTRLMSFYPRPSSSFSAAGVAAICPKHPISRAQSSRQMAALGALQRVADDAAYGRRCPSLCENAQEPTRRRIVFSIALFPNAAAAAPRAAPVPRW